MSGGQDTVRSKVPPFGGVDVLVSTIGSTIAVPMVSSFKGCSVIVFAMVWWVFRANLIFLTRLIEFCLNRRARVSALPQLFSKQPS